MLTPAHDWSSYDRIVDRYDERWGGRFEAVARQIWTIIRPQSGVRALDIGTGSGIVPRALPAVVTDVGLAVGCDPSLAMLRQAANRVSNLHLISADAAALPFADRTFDVVTASFVLSHVPDYSTALAESHRVLRPGVHSPFPTGSPFRIPTVPPGANCCHGSHPISHNARSQSLPPAKIHSLKTANWKMRSAMRASTS